tara:strand:+ start:716 stop:1075 length:360 start_codon:yes stop_codon:yes gene_type:complete
MSDEAKDSYYTRTFSSSGLTPKQEEKFFKKIAAEENAIIEALKNKEKLKGSKASVIKKGSKAPVIKKGSKTPVIKKGSKAPVIKKMGGGYIEKEMIKKKHGGKIIYKMSGGRVVDAGYE